MNFMKYFNPFLANVSILHSLKTHEKLWISGIFKGYKMGTFVKNTYKDKPYYSNPYLD